jgi:hypothetical protein
MVTTWLPTFAQQTITIHDVLERHAVAGVGVEKAGVSEETGNRGNGKWDTRTQGNGET